MSAHAAAATAVSISQVSCQHLAYSAAHAAYLINQSNRHQALSD